MARSGTSLLSGLVASTGRVSPVREWFALEEPPSSDVLAYVERLVGATHEDVFGVKFVDSQLWRFLAELRASMPAAGLSDRAALERVFPSPRFVWLARRDAVAQAISFCKAAVTGEWWLAASARPTPPVTIPPFDFDEVERRIRAIEEGTATWERWFEANEVEPLRLVYEELVANPVEEARRVLHHLGVVVSDAAIAPRSAKQWDAINEDWMSRYRSIAASRR